MKVAENMSAEISIKRTNSIWARLILQFVGMLFISFGTWSLFSAILMKWSLEPLPAILANLAFGAIGVAFIVTSYYLIQLRTRGRNLACLLIAVNFVSLVLTTRSGFTNADSVFFYRFWAFQRQYVSNNPVRSDSLITLFLFGLIGLHILFFLLLLSKPVAELVNNQNSAK